MEAVNKGMAKGAFWMIFMRVVTRGIGLVSTVILVRLLMPADFGLVAMAMTIIAAFELMGAFSLDVVLIQNRDAERSHYDTAWTFGVIAAALQALILFSIAHLVARFYNDPRLTNVVFLLAMGVLIQGFENIGVVAFRKDMEFHKDFKFQVTKKLFSFAVTMVLALWLRNYWALVGGTLVSRFMGVAFSYAAHPYRPKFSLAVRGELFHFSKWLFINNLLMFANDQSANFILGRLGGPHALGLYTVASEISNLPTTDLVAPINRAIFPGYAKMAHDLSMLRQGFINVISTIAIAAFPVCAGIVLLAEPLVHVMLGGKWLEAIPLIQILSIAGLTQALQTNKSSIYLALGRPGILTLVYALQFSGLLPALIFGSMENGVMGAAEGTLFVCSVLMPFNYAILFKIMKLPVSQFLAILWRPVVSTIVMGLALKIGLRFAPSGNTFLIYFSQLIFGTIIGSITYAGSIVFFWAIAGRPQGIEELVLRKILGQIKSFS